MTMSQSTTPRISRRYPLSGLAALAGLGLLAVPPNPEPGTRGYVLAPVRSQAVALKSSPSLAAGSSPFAAFSTPAPPPSHSLPAGPSGSHDATSFFSFAASASPTSPAAAAAAVADTLCHSRPWMELEAAYRDDLANTHYPMYLDVAEGMILAGLLKVGAEIYQVAPGRAGAGTGATQIVHRATFNEEALDDASALRLLCHGRHYRVLEPAETEQTGSYFEQLEYASRPEYYRETGEPVGGVPGQVKPVPADGNCLITGLYFLKHERFPTQDEVAGLRHLLAAQVTPAQIRQAIEEMVLDLLENAGVREWADGRFPTWGPNLSAMLLEDPGFTHHFQRAGASSRDEQLKIEAEIRAHRLPAPTVPPLPAEPLQGRSAVGSGVQGNVRCGAPTSQETIRAEWL